MKRAPCLGIETTSTEALGTIAVGSTQFHFSAIVSNNRLGLDCDASEPALIVRPSTRTSTLLSWICAAVAAAFTS